MAHKSCIIIILYRHLTLNSCVNIILYQHITHNSCIIIIIILYQHVAHKSCVIIIIYKLIIDKRLRTILTVTVMWEPCQRIILPIY